MIERHTFIDASPTPPPGAMRRVDWGELVARLAAARDLHDSLAQANASASFAPAIAGRDNSEEPVNHCVSGVGKGVPADCPATNINTGKSDRETP